MNRTEEYIYYNNLYDIYGPLLNKREQEIFTLFFAEDLSLQEIADIKKISKSAVGKSIQIIKEKLKDYENKLKFMAKEQMYLQKIVKLETKDVK